MRPEKRPEIPKHEQALRRHYSGWLPQMADPPEPEVEETDEVAEAPAPKKKRAAKAETVE